MIARITTPFGFPDGSRRNAARRIRDLHVSMLAQYFQLVMVPDADCHCRAIRPGNQPLVIHLLLWLPLAGVFGFF